MARRQQPPSMVQQLATYCWEVDAFLARMEEETSGFADLLTGDLEPPCAPGLPEPAGELLYFVQLVLPRLERLAKLTTEQPAVVAAAERAREFYETGWIGPRDPT